MPYTLAMASGSLPTNGKAIRRRRILAGYTSHGFAEQARVSQGYLSNLERGKRFGSPPVLKRIADALGCEVADLVDEEALSAA